MRHAPSDAMQSHCTATLQCELDGRDTKAMRCTHPQCTEDHPPVVQPRLYPARSDGVPAAYRAQIVDVYAQVALQLHHRAGMVAELLAAGGKPGSRSSIQRARVGSGAVRCERRRGAGGERASHRPRSSWPVEVVKRRAAGVEIAINRVDSGDLICSALLAIIRCVCVFGRVQVARWPQLLAATNNGKCSASVCECNVLIVSLLRRKGSKGRKAGEH